MDKVINRKLEFLESSGYKTLPKIWQRVLEDIYFSYPLKCLPNGICDPVYIVNTIALRLGLGDGKSNFKVLNK